MSETPEDKKAKEAEAKAAKAAEDKKKAEDKKAKVRYFVSRSHAGLSIQTQKMVKQPDNSEKQEIDEEESFVQYYDTFKGDVIRVGYLKTESSAIAKRCEEDDLVEEITEKEYNLAVEGDEKHKPLNRAPVPAAG